MARIPKIVIADNPLGIDLNREVVYEDTTKVFTDLVGNTIDPLELEHVKDDIRFTDAKEAIINTVNTTIVNTVQSSISESRIPKNLKTFDKIRFKTGEEYKICYYNGFGKTCEVSVKDLTPGVVTAKINLKADNGVNSVLNLLAPGKIYETDLYIYNSGVIRSNLNNQDGGSITFGRDTIGNCYQFEVIKIK